MVDDKNNSPESEVKANKLDPEKRKMMPRKKVGRKSNLEKKMLNVPHRVPVSGDRDILTVTGFDTNKYHMRWVKDVGETGSRIFKYRRAGYEFVPAVDVEIGQELVYRSQQVGSIVRVPANHTGEYLYLMFISKDLYKQDQAQKSKSILDQEREVTRQRDENPNDPNSLYGSGAVSKTYRPPR